MITDFSQFMDASAALDWIQGSKGLTRDQARQWLLNNVPKEQYYQTKIMEWLKKNVPGAFFWKATQGAYSRLGIPDICVIMDGQFYGFEVKRPFFGTTSTMQEQTIKRIREAGGKAYVVTYTKDVAKILLPERKEK